MQRENLEALAKEQLVDLLLAQSEQLARLQATFEQLKADYEALKYKFEHNQKPPKPPTTSKNSSQPPSRDQKANLPRKRHRKKHGPPEGHEPHQRKLVATPDQVVELHPQQCSQCQKDVSQVEGRLRKVNQITELPPANAEVIEVRQYEVCCPDCGQAQVAQPPAGLEMMRSFGARLEATVVYLRQEQHLSYQRTQEALQALNGVHLSQGAIDRIMQRAGQSALEQVPAIQAVVASSPVVYCDETGDRVNGNSWWEWVFCTAQAVLHWVRDNRSVDTIRDVMGQHTAQVWVSDGLPSQLKAPAQERQLCLAHLLRNLQKVVEHTPGSWWAKAVQAVLRAAIHLHHQRCQLAAPQFACQVVRVERVLYRLLERPHPPPEARYMLRRLQKYRRCLFVFLHRADVEPTNNVCERALRASVVHRKVTNGFRSEWGARAYAALASVIDTGELSGLNAFQSILSLFGPPALPFSAGRE